VARAERCSPRHRRAHPGRVRDRAHPRLGVGLPNVHPLDGGITAWQQQAAPVTRGRARWDIERQVRLVAGGIVFVAVMGGLLLPGRQYLAAAIGAGLAIAALTHTCALGMLLARLPYNRGASCDLDTVVDRLRTGTAR